MNDQKSKDMNLTSKYPPGPHVLKALYFYLSGRSNPLHFVDRLIREYGDIVHIQFLNRHHYFISHPDYIEKLLTSGYKVRTSRPHPLRHALGRGLITSQGDFHRTMRSMMLPFFQKQTVTQNAGMILEQTEKSMEEWKNGEVRDVAKDMLHLTLGIILRTLFGVDFKEDIPRIGEAAYQVHLHMNQDIQSNMVAHLKRIPFLESRTTAGRARRYLDQKFYGVLEERRKGGNLGGPDFISYLLRMQKTHKDGKDITDRQIRDEIITMFMAGHETLSNALSWTWYLLSKHPEPERKVYEEIDRVFGCKRPSADELSRLVYTRMCFSESMRIYPPIWAAARRPVTEDLELGGYKIPMGSTIFYTQYLIHRDARFFPEPERFVPERFTPEEEAKRHAYAYFPFGGGNRRCIGENMAWLEGLLIVSAIAQRWRFHLVPDHPIDLEPLVSLKPRNGIRMVLEKRKSDPKTERKVEESSASR